MVFAGAHPINGWPIRFDNLDLALLRIETGNAAGGAPPQPITVVDNPGWRAGAANLFVVGYPAPPSYVPLDEHGAQRQDVLARLREIFGLRYREKYFAPGMVRRFDKSWVFEHDATTLGGNSGSLIGMLEGGFPPPACISRATGCAPIMAMILPLPAPATSGWMTR